LGIIVAVVGIVLVAAILRGPTQGRLLYEQYRVAHFQQPPEQIVYQFSPAVAAVADPNAFFGLPVPKEAEHHGSGDDDDCELLPPHVVPPGGSGDPAAVDSYNRYLNYPLTDNLQVLFAHELTTPQGLRRIVIVEFGEDPRPIGRHLAFEILLVEPATLSGSPRVVGRQRISAGDLHLPYVSTTCYAGQRDPQDPASFQLSFSQDAQRHLIAGTLLADGRHVTLAPHE
jgi:hypothetical protein